MTLYIFTDHEGIERVLRCHSLDRAHAAAYNFVFAQTGSYAAAAVAMRTVREEATR